jgi:uncharacterized protein YcnI
LVEKVLQGYDDFYAKDQQIIKQKKGMNGFEESKDSVGKSYSSGDAAVNMKKQELRSKMGNDVFEYYYDFLYEQRHNPNTDEARLRA